MGILNNNVVVGVGAAVAATVLAPVVLPVIATVGRPLAKSLIRGGLLLYASGREAVALAGEVAEDLIAEIHAENLAQAAAAAAATHTQEPAPRPQQEPPGRTASPYTGMGEEQDEGASVMQAVPPNAAAGAGAH